MTTLLKHTQSIATLLILFFITALPSTQSFSQEVQPINGDSQQVLSSLLRKNKGKVIYLDFWASWCGPCRKSFPWMNKIQQAYNSETFTVISINLDSDKTLAASFLETLPADFPVIYDPKGKIAKKYKVKGMPSSYLINQQGNITNIHNGFFIEKTALYEKEIFDLIHQ